jgi:hypothetical protein
MAGRRGGSTATCSACGRSRTKAPASASGQVYFHDTAGNVVEIAEDDLWPA